MMSGVDLSAVPMCQYPSQKLMMFSSFVSSSVGDLSLELYFCTSPEAIVSYFTCVMDPWFKLYV